jgi:hypothetical protein
MRSQTGELSQASQDATWSSTGVLGIVAILDRGIKSLALGTELNRDELKLLFAPTGAFQETSIENGWSHDYLLLSAEFDRLIGSPINQALRLIVAA